MSLFLALLKAVDQMNIISSFQFDEESKSGNRFAGLTQQFHMLQSLPLTSLLTREIPKCFFEVNIGIFQRKPYSL